MVDLYIPEQKYDKNLNDNYYDLAKTGTLDVLGASFQETLYYNPANALGRTLEQFTGKGIQGRILSKEEWENSDYFRNGIEIGEDGIKEGLAQLFAERVDKRRSFNNVLQRSKGGYGLGAAQFGVALAGSLLDPLNVASGFIPSIAVARSATLAAKFGQRGKRFSTGLVDGAIGAAVLEPLVLGQSIAEQDKDYTLMDSFLNIALGGVLSGGLHYGIGKMSDRINKIKPTTRENIHKTATSQALTDEKINISKLAEESETVKIKQLDQEVDQIVVYDSKGKPKLVTKVSTEPDGKIVVKDTDGTEKILDKSSLSAKSIYDEDYEVDTFSIRNGEFSRDEFGNFNLKEITSLKTDELTKVDHIKMLNDLKETVNLSGKILKDQKKNIAEDIKEKYSKLGQVFKKSEIKKKIEDAIKNIDETLAVYERHINAIEIAKKRTQGKKVIRPKDPVKNKVSKDGEKDLQTSETIAEVKEGEELNPEQLSNTQDSTKIVNKLGALDEYQAKVNEIKNESSEYQGQTLEEINEENLSLQEELDDPNVTKDLPEVAQNYLSGLKAQIKTADALAEKATTSYEKAVNAGAACVMRGKT